MSVYVLNLAEAEGNMVKGESYKFIRMADDLHDVATYLADMRLCFILVTATGYLLLFIYLIMLCIRRNRRTQPRRRNWDYQLENQREYSNTGQQNTEDLVGVRSDGNASYMGRNHLGRGHTNTAPSFMRHGHINHQQTTRLMADQDGSVVKHQIPHITTEPPTEESKAKVPQLVKDSIES
ncbi:hypothetical protein RB195_021973 [Necator americanus]|uniref:Uncharacterized protein n=1 Tax=Necator americanus TaxID=51031 RepID=A0ABR1EDE8_NECAM